MPLHSPINTTSHYVTAGGKKASVVSIETIAGVTTLAAVAVADETFPEGEYLLYHADGSCRTLDDPTLQLVELKQ